MNLNVKLILASGSPRRRELLSREGISFDLQPSQVEELPPGAREPEKLATENSLLKARDILAKNTDPEAIILGSDTIVVIEGQTLGKPRDLAEGAAMLRLLAGRWHEVMTGFALISHQKEKVFLETTRVRFQELSDQEISDYQDAVHVLDKAGGYAIQDGGERIIAEVVGCRDNVMGLPVGRVLTELNQF